METGLAGKGVIVTGGASGIGEATVLALAAEAARVVVIDRDEAGLANLRRTLNDETVGIVADLSDLDQTTRATKEAISRLGRAHVLINVAGVGFPGNILETPETQYDKTFAVNVRAVFLTCSVAIPHMLEHGGGVILNVASAAATKGVRDRAVYAASKAAVVALTRSIAVDFGDRGIRANCVAPGTTETPLVRAMIEGASDSGGLRPKLAARQIVGRLGRPAEIADVICFLVSDRASFVHGAVVAVDGGMSAW